MPDRIIAAAGCLMTSPYVQENLRTLRLKLGDTASLRFRIGSIPGTSPTADLIHLVIYASDERSGWLFLIDSDHNGGFVVVRNAYRLSRKGRKWHADEGNGGLGTYEALSRYAESLFGTQRYAIQLKQTKDNCSVE
jgi:hypothetical protein